MALTPFQRHVCQLLAENRVRIGESYVAGGAALNELLRAPRLSRDVDLFHDTEEALVASWRMDRESLERDWRVPESPITRGASGERSPGSCPERGGARPAQRRRCAGRHLKA